MRLNVWTAASDMEVRMYVRDVESALEAAAKNRYWREGDAEMVVSFWRDSGQTVSAFCGQWGINVARLRRWQRRLADRELPTFHVVSVISDHSPAEGAPTATESRGSDRGTGVEVVLQGGRRVVAHPGFDEATLLGVVRLLEGARC